MSIYVLKQKTFAEHPEFLEQINPKKDTIEVLAEKSGKTVLIPMEVAMKLRDYAKLKFFDLPEEDEFVFYLAGKYSAGKEVVYMDLQKKYEFTHDEIMHLQVIEYEEKKKKDSSKKKCESTVVDSKNKLSKSDAKQKIEAKTETTKSKGKYTTLIKKYLKDSGLNVTDVATPIKEALKEATDPIGFEVILAIKTNRNTAKSIYPLLKSHFDELKNSL